MTEQISVTSLRDKLDAALANTAELAVFDVREAGQYASGHLFFATHVPYSRLEAEVCDFVPHLDTSIVIYDAGDGVSEKAAAALSVEGYTDVAVMEGGAPAWAAAGHTLYEGVNLPSKTFGELVEHELDTPRLSADDLAGMQEKGGDFIILDGRTPEEYHRFSIPGGISCPNAELPLRFNDLVTNAETTVVINCAGRTRSIIGAQTLINFGIANKVIALENGTQGWALADRELEYGAKRFPPSGVMVPAMEQAWVRAKSVADRYDLSFVDHDTLAEWQGDVTRTLYLLDVRSRDEYVGGHLPGSRHAPGGQLVQATDRWVGVRGARIVVCDDTEVRAVCTAHWLKQMGWDVHVLEGGIGSDGLARNGTRAPAPKLPIIEVCELMTMTGEGKVCILDLRPSADFEARHILGATWVVRPNLQDASIVAGVPIVMVADDQGAAGLLARDLFRMGHDDIHFLAGGMSAWENAGGAVADAAATSATSARIDFIAFTAERHGGNKDHMRQYLEWEINLVNQLDEQERGVFTVLAP
ncbi:MAG: rhodanese-like domain-containing protein [Alphaproteobacteria bacterium]|nr:rhodanese-like domain-containing protein [Alphaproteobacteria bacterium]